MSSTCGGAGGAFSRAKCLVQGHIATGFLNEGRVVWSGGVHAKCGHANDAEQEEKD